MASRSTAGGPPERDLVIIGAGGHAREMLEAVWAANTRRPSWNFRGFLSDDPARQPVVEAMGAAVLGPVELLAEWDIDYMIGVGVSRARAVMGERVSSFQARPAVLVHPAAEVGDSVVLGPGVYVAAGAVVTANVTLGPHVHVNVAASISHDCMVDEYCSVGPGVRLAGEVSVGARTELGIGAVVRPRTRIGSDVVVGAGAVVVRDVAPGLTVAGVPARPLPGHP